MGLILKLLTIVVIIAITFHYRPDIKTAVEESYYKIPKKIIEKQPLFYKLGEGDKVYIRSGEEGFKEVILDEP